MYLTSCFAIGVFAFSAVGGTPLPELAVPNGFGVNIHFRGEPRDLDLITEAGFKFVRMDLTWEGVEEEKGIHDFERAGYDALTEGCTRRGIRILYILDYSNKLYESERSVRTEEGREAFAAFAEAAARRYSGRGILWEIWNEPNIGFWKPQPGLEDYCKLVEATARRIREADPSGLVVAPATSGIPFEWMEKCFEKGLLGWIDVLSVHPYRPQPPETVMKDYAKLRELIKQHAPEDKEIPIISGEWGYSLINWNKSRLPEEQQAQYLVRMFLINLYQGVPVSIWYDWKDDGTDPDEREHHFGTVGHDLNPKPAYLAAKALARTLDGYSVAERINLGKDEDFAFRLKKGHTEVLAFWTTEIEHKITLPIEGNSGILVKMLGEESAVSPTDGRLEVNISPSPQYVIISI